jgi:hypothetical protein
MPKAHVACGTFAPIIALLDGPIFNAYRSHFRIAAWDSFIDYFDEFQFLLGGHNPLIENVDDVAF